MADATQSPLPSTERRVWYRLHFSTWIIVFLGALVAALVLVPGDEGFYSDQRAAVPDPAIVHGWPLTYLWRTIGNPAFFGDDSAKSPFVWKLFDNVKEFRPSPVRRRWHPGHVPRDRGCHLGTARDSAHFAFNSGFDHSSLQ